MTARLSFVDLRELASLDLNLLLHLQALLEERHVSRAAERLGSSQPAMSRALAKLRLHFGDPLLVRTGNSLLLTERAKILGPGLEEVLRAVEHLTHGTRFDPVSAKGTLRLSAPDIVALMLLPPLLRRLAMKAPHLDVEVVQWRSDWQHPLERGEIDLTVGFPKGAEAGLYARPLFEQDWAVVLRRDHPTLRRRWTPEAYASLAHVVVTAAGRGPSVIDDALSVQGLSRRIHVRVPYPLMAPMLAERCDVAVTTVRFLALQLAEQGGLVVKRPPLAVPPLRVPMVWHERSQNDARHRWVRDQILGAAETLPADKLRWKHRAPSTRPGAPSGER